MGFKVIVSAKAARTQAIMGSFRVSKKGKGTFFVSVPSALAGKGWGAYDQCRYALGEDADAGLLKIAGADGGAFKVGRMRSSLVFRVPQQQGWSGVAFDSLPLTVLSSGVSEYVVKLPDELTKLPASPVARQQDAPAAPRLEASRPGGKPPLSIVGTTLELNGKRVKLNAQYFKVFSLLWKGWGEIARTSYIITSFEDDIDLPKIIAGLRELLEPLDIGVVMTPNGYGLVPRIA